MLLQNQYPFNKSIMVGVVGVPNVGKSSLINYFLGFDLSAVTSKPQTTRNRFHCVLSVDHTEIILVDTPGFHRSSQEINIRMNYQAAEELADHDLNLVLMDLGRNLPEQFSELKRCLGPALAHVRWVVFTKSDLLGEEAAEKAAKAFFQEIRAEVPALEKYFVTSTTKGDGLHLLLGEICDRAQNAPHLYPEGDVSNKNERFFVTEYIREQAFLLLKEELPYELAVTIDEFRKGHRVVDGKGVLNFFISASILVNRLSQRAIVVGSKGGMIKDIGVGARKKIEALLGFPVHLNLHVKVSPAWFKNNFILEELGLPRAPLSKRVWRKRL